MYLNASRRGSDGKRSYCYRTWKPIVFTTHTRTRTHTHTRTHKQYQGYDVTVHYIYTLNVFIFFFLYNVSLKFCGIFRNLVMFLTPTSRSLQRPVDPRLPAESFHNELLSVIGFIICYNTQSPQIIRSFFGFCSSPLFFFIYRFIIYLYIYISFTIFFAAHYISTIVGAS